MSRALAASMLVSALMELRLLNKKCGLILRLQRLQFRVSRENAAFQRTSLRGARLFYLQDHVVRSHGQRIKHETRREQQRRLRRKFLIESLKCVHLR